MKSTVNYSSLQSGSWYMSIEGLEDVVFKLKNFYIPSIELPEMKLGGTGDWHVKLPGTRLDFGNVQFEFSVDSDFKNYRTLFEWIKRSVTKPEFKKVTVFILDGEKKLQNVTIEYYEVQAVRLTPILLDAQNSITEVHCSLDVAYQYFDFV